MHRQPGPIAGDRQNRGATVKPSLRILIVEDEILIALELETLLREEGHDLVGIVATAAEVIGLGPSVEADLALVDIHLADGPTGIEAAHHLAASGRTGVLFMTANGKRLPDDQAGAWGLIAKPYTERGVLNALRYVVRCLAGGPTDRPPDSLLLAPDFPARIGAFRARWETEPARIPERRAGAATR